MCVRVSALLSSQYVLLLRMASSKTRISRDVWYALLVVGHVKCVTWVALVAFITYKLAVKKVRNIRETKCKMMQIV